MYICWHAYFVETVARGVRAMYLCNAAEIAALARH